MIIPGWIMALPLDAMLLAVALVVLRCKSGRARIEWMVGALVVAVVYYAAVSKFEVLQDEPPGPVQVRGSETNV